MQLVHYLGSLNLAALGKICLMSSRSDWNQKATLRLQFSQAWGAKKHLLSCSMLHDVHQLKNSELKDAKSC